MITINGISAIYKHKIIQHLGPEKSDKQLVIHFSCQDDISNPDELIGYAIINENNLYYTGAKRTFAKMKKAQVYAHLQDVEEIRIKIEKQKHITCRIVGIKVSREYIDLLNNPKSSITQ